MIKVFGGMGICLPMVALSAPATRISEQIKISTVNGCPVAQLRLENHSRTTVYVDDVAPMLSIVDESGVPAKYLFSPASYNSDDINNYIKLISGGTHVYHIRLAMEYELKPGREYQVIAGGGQFTDPVTHRHVEVSGMQAKFRYAFNCVKR